MRISARWKPERERVHNHRQPPKPGTARLCEGKSASKPATEAHLAQKGPLHSHSEHLALQFCRTRGLGTPKTYKTRDFRTLVHHHGRWQMARVLGYLLYKGAWLMGLP